jgi:SOS-response transcriptional repressor LexA
MPEQNPNTTNKNIRPTKKQRELLEFIDGFIKQHNYSPSYREIMSGLAYTSVATVALHVNSLIKRGHLAKRSGKARSLEVVKQEVVDEDVEHRKWVKKKVNVYLSSLDEKIRAHQQAGLTTVIDILGINM